MGEKPTIKYVLLSTIGLGGCVSRHALRLFPFHYQRVTASLKQLVDNGLIRLVGKGKKKHYRLLLAGKEALSAYKPHRYPPELLDHGNTPTRRPDRAVECGDVALILTLAGYAVHPHDKPPLPAHTPDPAINQTVDEGWRQLYQNSRSAHIANADESPGRDTPVCCFYRTLGIKRYLEREAMASGQSSKSVRGGSATGILIMPSDYFRVYSSAYTAMKVETTKERNYQVKTEPLFTGYTPRYTDAILVFGNDFTSAEKIIDNSMDNGQNCMTKRKEQLLSANNLGNPLYYLTMHRESLPLLRFMQFPMWRPWLYETCVKTVFHQFYPFESGVFYGEAEGAHIFIGLDLNLTAFAQMMKRVRDNHETPVTIVCFEWQRDFYAGVFERHLADVPWRLLFRTISEEMFTMMESDQRDYWGGDIDTKG